VACSPKFWRPSVRLAPGLPLSLPGREPDALIRLTQGECDWYLADCTNPEKSSPQTVDGGSPANAWRRHSWMRGAAAKVRDEGKSLLPIGMVQVEGELSRGDVIAVRDEAGARIARGLANYASAEARSAVSQAIVRIRAPIGLCRRARDAASGQPGAQPLSLTQCLKSYTGLSFLICRFRAGLRRP